MCSNKFKMKQKLCDVIVSALTKLLLDIILINIAFAIFLSKLNLYVKSLRYTMSQFNCLKVSLINSTSQHSIISSSSIFLIFLLPHFYIRFILSSVIFKTNIFINFSFSTSFTTYRHYNVCCLYLHILSELKL